MGRGSIRLSDKHGVNPSVTRCFFCGEDISIALFGRLKDDAEAPRTILDPDPCDKCKGLIADGVFLIEVDEAKTSDMKNPWRTGRLCVLRDEAIRRIFDEESAEAACKKRVAFIEIEAYEAIGLHNAPETEGTA